MRRLINVAWYSKVNHVQDSPIVRAIFRNQNLRFDAEDHFLYLIPRHPSIERTGANSYFIDDSSIVLTFAFVKKAQTEDKLEQNWVLRKKLQFRFQNIAQLLDVEPESGKQHSIINETIIEKKSKQTIYSIIDNTVKKAIEFQLKSQLSNGEDNFSLSTSYTNYLVIQEIIKESIMDMSGLRLQLDLKRMEALQVVNRSLQNMSNKDKEAQQYYKQE